MDILIGIVLILHFVGLAALLGGVLVQVKDTIAGKGRIIAAMIHGALTQLVTGILLVGLLEMSGGDVNNTKIAVKLQRRDMAGSQMRRQCEQVFGNLAAYVSSATCRSCT